MNTYAYGIAVIQEVTVPDYERGAAASPYTAEKPATAPRYRRVPTAGLMGGGFMT